MKTKRSSLLAVLLIISTSSHAYQLPSPVVTALAKLNPLWQRTKQAHQYITGGAIVGVIATFLIIGFHKKNDYKIKYLERVIQQIDAPDKEIATWNEDVQKRLNTIKRTMTIKASKRYKELACICRCNQDNYDICIKKLTKAEHRYQKQDDQIKKDMPVLDQTDPEPTNAILAAHGDQFLAIFETMHGNKRKEELITLVASIRATGISVQQI